MLAVVIYFILCIAFIVFGVVGITLQAEWWVAGIMFAFAVLLLCIAFAKLDDETDLFNKIQEKIKSKKEKKENQERFNIFGEKSQPINFVTLTNDVWNLVNSLSGEEYKNCLLKKIYISFNEIEKMIKRQMKEQGYTYNNEVFNMFSEIISHYMICDDELTDEEFDIYRSICFTISHKPLTKAKLIQLRNSTDIDRLRDDVRFFLGCRSDVAHSIYLELLQGICMLSYIGNSSFNENAFYILRTFLFDYYDEIPADWQEYLNAIK